MKFSMRYFSLEKTEVLRWVCVTYGSVIAAPFT